ncbi:MAG: phage portal protein [Candidatus Eremiobacteraeota bacterium]|nr:phage portal protein [Candidatus Eremiobacteraeota bacterium]
MSAPTLYGPDGRPHEIRKAGVGPMIAGAGATSTVSSIIASGQRSRNYDLDVYAMLSVKHPTVYACITLIADAVASEGWEIVPRGHRGAQPANAQTDPRVAANIADANDFFAMASPHETDRARNRGIAADLKTFGFAALRKKRANIEGKPVLAALERVDPRTISIRLNAAGTAVDSYLIKRRSNGALATSTSMTEIVPPADIVFFTSSGGDPITGFTSPLEALDLTLATDLAQRRYRETYCRTGAKPGLVLTSDTYDEDAFKVTEEQILKQRTGAANAYKTLLLPGGWKMVNVPSAGGDDADFVEATGLNREDITGVYRVPMGMVVFAGNALGSGGKGEDREFFERYGVLPVEELIYERLTISVLRDEFGITDLEMVPKRRNAMRADRLDDALKMVQVGFAGDDVRTFLNAPRTELPGMQTPLFIRAGKSIAEDEPIDPASAGAATTTGTSADAAQAQHEVAQKGAGRFRRGRQGY